MWDDIDGDDGGADFDGDVDIDADVDADVDWGVDDGEVFQSVFMTLELLHLLRHADWMKIQAIHNLFGTLKQSLRDFKQIQDKSHPVESSPLPSWPEKWKDLKILSPAFLNL